MNYVKMYDDVASSCGPEKGVRVNVTRGRGVVGWAGGNHRGTPMRSARAHTKS